MAGKDADRDPIWGEHERWQRNNSVDVMLFQQAMARNAHAREAARAPQPKTSPHAPDLVLQSLDSMSALLGGGE